MKTLFHLTSAGIFWLWNLTFLSVVYIGILPYIAVPLARGVPAGEIEAEFLISILGIVVTPTICTLIGWLWARNRPLELLRLFYGIEAPLLLLFSVRSFLLRELTPASQLILGTVLACIAAFCVELLWGYFGWQTENDSFILPHPRKLGVVQTAPTRQGRRVRNSPAVRILLTFAACLLVLSTLLCGAVVTQGIRGVAASEGELIWEKSYFALAFWGATFTLTALVEGLRIYLNRHSFQWINGRIQLNFIFRRIPSPVRRRVGKILPWVQVATHTLMLFVGLYIGALLLFYAIPVAAWLLESFFSFNWVRDFWWQLTHHFWEALWFIPIFTILFSGSATLFLGMPSMFAALYVRAGRRIIRAFSSQYGKMRASQVALGTITAWLAIYIAFQNQPQTKAFQLLEDIPKTDVQRQELLAQSEEIREGLLNAYLSPYRYLGTWEQSNQIRIMYRSEFGFSEPILQGIQNAYNSLVSPFLYQGDRKDEQKASKLYEQFFDTPIQKGERQAVLRALKSTTILDDAKAGVLNINQEKVWLKQQAVTVEERGDWADVEIHETYNNQTFDVEEVFYSFSLPESAVITGVWLGDTAERDKRFIFKVSPRGAAQKVYNSQVRRSRPVDPALLEQVGPRQYRLRAFPIPPKVTIRERREGNIQRPTEMHLWLTYKVMRSDKGWELPSLGEKRNIFWTNETKRLRNGKAVKGVGEDWLEASFPPSNGLTEFKDEDSDSLPLRLSPALQKLHQIDLNGYKITAQPLTDEDYVLPQNQRLAIVLDTSRSMGTHREKLVKTFEWLKEQGFADGNLANNDADLYVTSPAGSQPKRLDDLRSFHPQKATFYGTLQLKEMLNQFVGLKGETAYDGIIVVTDEGSYELSKDKGDVPQMSAPLWVVHFGSLAPAYDDGTLKAIQDSGGGVSLDLSQVLQRIATTQSLTESSSNSAVEEGNVSVVDGYAWRVEKGNRNVSSQLPAYRVQLVSSNSQTARHEEGFAPLAARVLVGALSGETDGKQVEQLDAIHAIAKTYGIVTPYSSMIVLVNDEQRRLLEEAEASSDRFNRQVEDGKEQLNKPDNPLNTATVPEPGTIVGLAAIAIFFGVNRKSIGRK